MIWSSSSRRSVLKLSLASAALALSGGAALALQKTALRDGTPKLAALDASTYAVLCALADRLCPALGKGAPGALALKVPETIDGMLAQVEPDARQQVSTALLVLENALTGALFGERVRPFTKLEPREQDEAIADFRDSRVGFRRTLYRALSGLVLAVYWGDPRSWERIGYAGPPSTAGLRELYKDNLVDLDSLRATPLVQGA